MVAPEQDLAQYERDMEERGPVFEFEELHELATRRVESWRQWADEDRAEARFEARQQDW